MNNDIENNYKIIVDKKNSTAQKFGRNPNDIEIIAVSKTHPSETIKDSFESGLFIFGENYVQELVEKQSDLKDLGIKPEWHFIGHLQTNKVKYIAQFISMIHSVDSVKLANEINKQAAIFKTNIKILLQINTSAEASKSGADAEDVVQIAKEILLLPNVELLGLMTIGTFSDDENIIRREFRLLKKTLELINSELNLSLKELSMGMSHDFEIAIEEGSTMVRVGTAIFGDRDYTR